MSIEDVLISIWKDLKTSLSGVRKDFNKRVKFIYSMTGIFYGVMTVSEFGDNLNLFMSTIVVVVLSIMWLPYVVAQTLVKLLH